MPELRRIVVNGVELNVAVAGTGPAVLLLHGFPHTWELWRPVMAGLSGRHTVIAPDLRGFGASGPARRGYDAGTLAEDAAALLTALGVSGAAVAGIDAGTPPAFLLALRRPDLVRRLVVMESLLGRLPGAEEFLAGGAPWWFGFHSVPGLAEAVLESNEARYIDFFLTAGTLGEGVPADVRDHFVAAYARPGALRRAFGYYRALPESAAQLERAVATARLTVPTLAIGARPVGDALERQLRPVTDDLTGRIIEDCGHIIPLHRPRRLLELLRPFLDGHPVPARQVRPADDGWPGGRERRDTVAQSGARMPGNPNPVSTTEMAAALPGIHSIPPPALPTDRLRPLQARAAAPLHRAGDRPGRRRRRRRRTAARRGRPRRSRSGGHHRGPTHWPQGHHDLHRTAGTGSPAARRRRAARNRPSPPSSSCSPSPSAAPGRSAWRRASRSGSRRPPTTTPSPNSPSRPPDAITVVAVVGKAGGGRVIARPGGHLRIGEPSRRRTRARRAAGFVRVLRCVRLSPVFIAGT